MTGETTPALTYVTNSFCRLPSDEIYKMRFIRTEIGYTNPTDGKVALNRANRDIKHLGPLKICSIILVTDNEPKVSTAPAARCEQEEQMLSPTSSKI